jgi:hypothetical protein
MSFVPGAFISNLAQLVSLGSSFRLASSALVDETLIMNFFHFPYFLPLGSHRPILLLSNLIETDSQPVFVWLPLPLQQSCPKKQGQELLVFLRRLPSGRPKRWFNCPCFASSWTSFAWTPWFAPVDFAEQLTLTLIFLAPTFCSLWVRLIGFLRWTAPSDVLKLSPCFSTLQKPFARYWTFSSGSFVNFCQYCFIYQTFAAADGD